MEKCINRHGNKDSYDEIWGFAKEPFQNLEKFNEITGITMELGDSIKIGEFTIYHITGHADYLFSLWIQKDDGEGMQVDKSKFEALLKQFWRDEF